MMKKKLLITVTITLITMLTSCSEGARDVQYYIDHPDKRVEMFKKCKYDVNQNRESLECKSVFEAHLRTMNQGSEMPRIK